MWCPAREKKREGKWMAENDASEFFMVPVSPQMKSDNPHPALDESSFSHRPFCPGVLN